MFHKSLLALSIVLFSASIVVAQCRCKKCANQGDATDGVYQQAVCSGNSGAGCVGDSCGDCGSGSDWNEDFYDCCHKTRFDYRVCDPCCHRPYVSAFGGATGVDNFERQLVIDPTGPVIIEYQGANLIDGYGAGVAAGYRVHQQFRVELEYSYRFNQVDRWYTREETDGALSAFADEAATGRVYSHAGMFNLVYDLSPRRVRCLNLYGGGGIGVLTVDALINTATTTYTSDDSAFAWQFIGGVNLPITKRIEVFSEYRYLGADELSVFDATNGVTFGNFEYDSHNVFAGVRIGL